MNVAKRMPMLAVAGLLLLLAGGCSRVDNSDKLETDPQSRLQGELSYSLWTSRQHSAPDIYFYNTTLGRVVRDDGRVDWFKWHPLPGGQAVEITFKNKRMGVKKATVSTEFNNLRYQEVLYEPQGHLNALAVLLQAGQMTGWLVFDVVLIIVILTVSTNLIVYLNSVDTRLKRKIKMRGSDLGYYLRMEKPEFVSVNHSPPMRFRLQQYMLDAGGIQVNVEQAEQLEEGPTPLFQVRSGTQLRFYPDHESAQANQPS